MDDRQVCEACEHDLLVAVCEELGERKAAAVDRRSNSNVAAADAIMLAVEERGIWTVSKASKIKGIH